MKDIHVVRRVLAWLLAGLLMISAVPAIAETAFVDLEEPCALTVQASTSQDATFIADLEKAGVQIDLYLVANAVKQVLDKDGAVIKDVTGYDTYIYELVEPFTELTIPETEDAADPRPTSEEWRAIADQAAEIILSKVGTDEALEPAATAAAGAKIEKLTAGLYAIVARGEGIDDYARQIPVEGEEGAQRYVSAARSDAFEYQFPVEIISLPTKEAAEGGQANTADTTPWIYAAQAVMKPGRVRMLGDLRINKALDLYKTGEPATFVFEVEIEDEYDPLATYPVKRYMLNFSGAGDEYVLVKDLPAGAKVTVTEVYSGATYKLVDSDPEAVIVAEEIVETYFENTFTETPKGGYGILNQFTYSAEADTWNWGGLDTELDNAGQEVVK